jgi:hypothetical protein
MIEKIYRVSTQPSQRAILLIANAANTCFGV